MDAIGKASEYLSEKTEICEEFIGILEAEKNRKQKQKTEAEAARL